MTQQFVKQRCSVNTEVSHRGVTTQKMTKKLGYMYKGLLHLIKAGPNSWVLSHELTGYSITSLNYTNFNCAKKATILIYSLLDWNTDSMEDLKEKMREENNSDMLREIVSAEEDTLERLRLKMLEEPQTNADMINLMTG